MEIWIRIRNIPVNHFTVDTMFKLASEVGKVEEIAYDSKVSHTKDYIRAKVTFNLENPAKEFRKLSLKSGGSVDIKFEYERIHKKCFHCLRLTHEKIRCPLLRKEYNKEKLATQEKDKEKALSKPSPPERPLKINDGPPGFPLLFPELSESDRQMALLYISHADPT